MICQECSQRPATLHFTKIVNGEKTEVHMCDKCAQEKGESYLGQGGDVFSFNHLLSGLLNIDTIFQQNKANAFAQTAEVRCKTCGLSFKEFAHAGKFGCADCYKTFNGQLDPILKRVHGGNTAHTGKIPARIGGTIHLKKQLQELRQTMKGYIEQEEFEKAAEIRDQIRSLEKGQEAGKGGGPK